MVSVNYRWETRRLPRPPKSELVPLAVRAAELTGLPMDFDWELNIRFVGDRTMAHANKEFVGHLGTTDVITFSYFDDPGSLFPGEPAVELIICIVKTFSRHDDPAVDFIIRIEEVYVAGGNYRFAEFLPQLHDLPVDILQIFV